MNKTQKETGITAPMLFSDNYPATRRGSGSRLALFFLLVILALAAFSRLVALGADLPAWLQGAFITDEGWWADSARGKVFFNDFFADDFGTAYLVTPAYTWALQAIYQLGGVGLAQTRLLAALSNILIIAAVAWLVWRKAGPKESAVAALLLALSPFFWVYGRVALQESMQALMVTLSFACLLFARRSPLAAAGTGLAMALAIAVKPNAIFIGAFPVALAALGLIGRELAQARAGERGPILHAHAALLLYALAGFTLSFGLVFLIHILPNWKTFWPMLLAEGGSTAVTWKMRLTQAGIFMLSTEMGERENKPILWALARWSPAIMALTWLYLVSLMLRLRGGCLGLVRAMSELEAAACFWALGTWAANGSSFFQPDRRYVLLVPGLAILASLLLCRLPDYLKGRRTVYPTPRFPYAYAFMLWLILLLPAMLTLKPWVSRLIMHATRDLRMGQDFGLGYESASTIFMFFWFLLLLGLMLRRKAGERLGARLLDHRLVILLPALLLLYEASVIGRYFAHPGTTFLDRQAELARYAKDGEVVMGHVASTFFLPFKVRTVRRVSRFEFTPPPNPDIWDRLKPRYIMEMTGRNYVPAPLYYDDLLDERYRLVHQFGIGPYRAGVPRYTFSLYQYAPKERREGPDKRREDKPKQEPLNQ